MVVVYSSHTICRGTFAYKNGAAEAETRPNGWYNYFFYLFFIIFEKVKRLFKTFRHQQCLGKRQRPNEFSKKESQQKIKVFFQICTQFFIKNITPNSIFDSRTLNLMATYGLPAAAVFFLCIFSAMGAIFIYLWRIWINEGL